VTPRAAIQQIARMVREDIRSGELSPGAHSVGDMLAAQPEALLLIVGLVTDLRRSPERLELATGDRRDD
jgi:hypothetical protein